MVSMGILHKESTPLERGAKFFRFLSNLCKVAFIIIAIWSITTICFMCYSIFTADLPNNVFAAALAEPFIYTLYSANACMLPLIFGNFLGDISEERTPFTMKNSKRLKWLGFILLLYSVLEEALAFTASQFGITLASSSIYMESFARNHLPGAGTTLDLFPLLMSAMFFALSYVFKYGVLLQQESDETL